MTVTIKKKITGYSVATPEDRKAAVAPVPAEAKPTADVIQMHERIERPEVLIGSTYKIKSPLVEHAMYVTINDIVLNAGTEHEQRRPFEVFINCKSMEHFQWIVALTRIMSAVFRKGGDCTFLVEELKALGFNEVLLGDFRFPATDQIKFSGSKSETLNSAAQRLTTACTTNQFCLSFLIANTDFTLPAGRTRVYLENRTAADVKILAEELQLEPPEVNMVFLTDLKDTRFDAYGVLRPITSAQLEE